MSEKELEARIKSLEEYINCCDKKKEDEWKNCICKKLDSIENRQKRTAWQWIFSLGVSAFAVGISWVLATTPSIPNDYKPGYFVLAIGLLIMGLALVLSNKK